MERARGKGAKGKGGYGGVTGGRRRKCYRFLSLLKTANKMEIDVTFMEI